MLLCIILYEILLVSSGLYLPFLYKLTQACQFFCTELWDKSVILNRMNEISVLHPTVFFFFSKKVSDHQTSNQLIS